MKKKYFGLCVLLSLIGISIYKFNIDAMELKDLLNPNPSQKMDLHQALNQAVSNSKKNEALRLLLSEGVDIDVLTEQNKNRVLPWLEEITKVIITSNQWNTSTMKKLVKIEELIKRAIDSGASEKYLSKNYKIEAAIEAIKDNEIEELKFWLKHGVSPNAREPVDNTEEERSPLLLIAIIEGNYNIARYLLDSGAHIQLLNENQRNDLMNQLQP